MYPSIQINKKEDKLEIIVIPHFKPIMKIVFWLQGVLFLVGAFVLVVPLIITFDWEVVSRTSGGFLIIYLLLIAGIILFFLVSITHFKRMLGREIISLSHDQLKVKNKYWLFSSKSQVYQKSQVNNLRYLGRENFTSHPLKSESFEYMGFDTQEMENHVLIEGGRIGFEYFDEVVRFGKDLDEEDAKEIVTQISEFWRKNS